MGWLPVGADQVLVPLGASWKYLDNGSNLGTSWSERSFDDSGWASGPAELGYGDGDESTVVGYGPNASAKFITTYFRRVFSVANPSAFTSLALSVMRDDGVVLYLNGVEIYRNNMPVGTIGYLTPASSAIDPTGHLAASVSAAALVAGQNVLAAEIHQANGTSSDISFDLEVIGVEPGVPRVTRGPYLQRVTPNSIVVRWRTSVASDSRVRFGTSPANLDQVAGGALLTTEHSVALTGLLPNTAYSYAVGSTLGDLVGGPEYFFYTAPPAGVEQPMRFWVLGDPGTGMVGQYDVRNAYQNFNGNRYTDLVLLLGDNAYNSGTDSEYQAYLFNVYPTIFRSTPVFSTLGNHDTGGSTNPGLNIPYFLIFDHPTQGEAGGTASGTEKYYSFNYGNVHFVCLDSMTSSRATSGSMLKWLEQDLAQNTATWLVAFFHHPPYTKGSHDSDTEIPLVEMRQNALPLLERYGVDLVLGGHSHSYERSFLLNGHYGVSSTLAAGMLLDSGSGRDGSADGAYVKPHSGPAPNAGAVYVVPGSSGKISGGNLNHPAMFVSMNLLGSFVIDVNGTRLDARFITDQGVLGDHFTLLKGPPGNLPPAISVTSPAPGSQVALGSILRIHAQAIDSDGTVQEVEFLANGTRIGSVTGPLAGDSYPLDWQAQVAGTYDLTARATDDAGAVSISAPVQVSVVNLNQPPATPLNLKATSSQKGRVSLTWTDASSNETGFRIERGTTVKRKTTWSLLAQVGPNTGAYLDPAVVAGTSYVYRVQAFNDYGGSAFSNTSSVKAR